MIKRVPYIFLVTAIVAGAIFISGCTTESTTMTSTVTATQATSTPVTTSQNTLTTPSTKTIDIFGGSPSVEELIDNGFESPEIPRITSETLKKIMDQGESFILVDVRSGALFLRGHIPQSINFPADIEVEQLAYLHTLPKDQLIIFC